MPKVKSTGIPKLELVHV